ncbi:RNA methyltransferase [Qipengyuania sp. GH38]|uniref:TrmH family RNA methyltransferase n=1 Tax=Qipengyuania intermedia TaxID=2867244 RepID=UPI001C87C7F7|nr:RNA methyltransferase [Qipengyuania intermedia]MBX7513282.1 RNA methyltransferase [Qipengyuania intermedia]
MMGERSDARRIITGFSNPTVKALRALREKKHRKAAGKFLAEGLRLLTDARESGHVPETLVLSDKRDPHPLLSELERAVEASGGEIIETSPDILVKITGKDNPQAVAGVFAEFDTSLAALDRTCADIWLVAQALRDPGNLGTMLRTADAIGAGGVILIDDCADPFGVETVRASMGAIFTRRVARAEWADFEQWLRAGEGQLVAASLRDAQPYRSAPYAAPCFVMVGNESRGLPEEYEMACDLRVTMPMKGRADSLNAAVAAAVLGYEVLAALDSGSA